MIDVINYILPQKNKLEVIKEAPSWNNPVRTGTLMPVYNTQNRAHETEDHG